MSNEILGLVSLVTMVAVVFLGFPIAFTLIILAVIFGYIGFGRLVFDLMVLQTYDIMQSELLAAVPLFVFMGYVFEQAGLVDRLFAAFRQLMGPVRGSLYLIVLVIAAVFGIASGVVGASVTLLGIMAVPTMLRAGYDQRLTAGVITAGGTLGILIPPSVMLVVLAPVTGVSAIRLFAAAIMPGVVLTILFIAYAMIRSWLRPELGPPLPKEERSASLGAIWKELLIGAVPITILNVAALGTILVGLATATEAAAMGAAAAVIMALVYKRLTWEGFKQSCWQTLTTSSMVLFLAATANFYAGVFGRLGTGTWLTEMLLDLPFHPIGVLLLVMGVIFLLGWPFEWPAVILIFLPIILPVVSSLGFDLLWFSILVSVNLQTAFLSPPVAVAAYYLKGAAPQMDMKDIYAGMLQFMGLQVIGLLLVFLFPGIATWLPRLLYGSGGG